MNQEKPTIEEFKEHLVKDLKRYCEDNYSDEQVGQILNEAFEKYKEPKQIDNQISNLLTVLTITGEYPMKSLNLFNGNYRWIREKVNKLSAESEEGSSKRLFSVSGKADMRTIRLYKKALPTIQQEVPEAYNYYTSIFAQTNFPSDEGHKGRNHRIAEAVVMTMRAGIETRPYLLPPLQAEKRKVVIPTDKPCVYLSRALKFTRVGEANKTQYTRVIGVLYNTSEAYLIYNSRENTMKWGGKGEYKAYLNAEELTRYNSKITPTPQSILFCESEKVALETITTSENPRHPEWRFDRIYRNIHFVPLNEFGIRLLRIIATPNWKELILTALFDTKIRSYNNGIFEYDAIIEEGNSKKYILSHLDSDLGRLIRFKEAVQNRAGGKNALYEVICYPNHLKFVQSFLGKTVSYRSIPLETIEQTLGVKESDLLG